MTMVMMASLKPRMLNTVTLEARKMTMVNLGAKVMLQVSEDSNYHWHTTRKLKRSLDAGAKSMELKKLGTTEEHEDKDTDQGDKMG